MENKTAIEKLIEKKNKSHVEVVLSINNLENMIAAIKASKKATGQQKIKKAACGIFAFQVNEKNRADYHGSFRAVGIQTYQEGV